MQKNQRIQQDQAAHGDHAIEIRSVVSMIHEAYRFWITRESRFAGKGCRSTREVCSQPCYNISAPSGCEDLRTGKLNRPGPATRWSSAPDNEGQNPGHVDCSRRRFLRDKSSQE